VDAPSDVSATVREKVEREIGDRFDRVREAPGRDLSALTALL
jgi:hypothetical protein